LGEGTFRHPLGKYVKKSGHQPLGGYDPQLGFVQTDPAIGHHHPILAGGGQEASSSGGVALKGFEIISTYKI